jgi:RNA polymerase sigma factor (sigma-70 family)
MMTQDWPGPDDKCVIAEMMSDDHSPHWEQCLIFIRQLLSRMNVPADSEEDIVQQSLLSVKKKLAEFRHECFLKSWIKLIVVNKTRDELRTYVRNKTRLQIITEDLAIVTPQTVEEQYLQREQLREVIAGLQKFVAQHAHRTRNALILRLVLFEGYTCDEVAKQLKIERPVVYVVIRTARRYLREQHEE